MKRVFFLITLLSTLFFSGHVKSQSLIGKVAPPLTGIKMLDRKLPELYKKFILLDFWATWCGPCVQSFPHVNALAGKYKENIVFIALSDEKEEIVRNFLQRRKDLDNLYFGLDIQNNLNAAFSIKNIPTYYLISPDNTVLSKGISSALSDNYLDSIIAHYDSSKNKSFGIKISEDSLDKVLSIEIKATPGSTRYFKKSQFSFIARDTLRYILPYLSNVRWANKIRWENTPKDMIEVKIFSRNTPVDSIMMSAHDLILKTYNINKKEIIEPTDVYYLKVRNSALLKDSNYSVSPGVTKRNTLLNDSVYQLDNYSIKEMGSFIEGLYFPKIIYVDSKSIKVYDWNLEIVDKKTKTQVGFERFKEIMLRDFGIEFTKVKKNEKFTIYN